MIYIAAPLFSEMERDYIDKLVNILMRDLDLTPKDFYIPHKNDCNYESEIYDHNIENLNRCNMMVAILDGKDIDSGTAFEIGYFTAQGKPVLGLLTDKRSYDEEDDLNLKLNTMIFGSLDYGYEVYQNIDDLINGVNK